MEAYCTLFNHRYLSRGLALYESLQQHAGEFILYIFAMDDLCFQKLSEFTLPNAVIIPLEEFENDELKKVKPLRSLAEYCWTCTPASILYVLEHFRHDRCTYLDADLYFYGAPSELLDELGETDVSLITEHRFSATYLNLAKTSGIYCVQFMPFVHNEQGMKILIWWYHRCLECCSLEQSCGDQRYLNDWTVRFDGVHVLRHPGGGIAPWNVSDYTFTEDNGILSLAPANSAVTQKYPVIFYHFHAFKLYDKNVVRLSDYPIPDTAVSTIYKQYIRALDAVTRKYHLNESDADFHYTHNFISNDLDHLKHEKGYYNYNLFI